MYFLKILPNIVGKFAAYMAEPSSVKAVNLVTNLITEIMNFLLRDCFLN